MARVLFVDDSLSVRLVASRLLSAAGHEVILAANAAEGLARVADAAPDLVVADIIMPDQSGFHVCAEIRLRDETAELPVLLISGIVDEDTWRQAEACRANAVIKKPFLWNALISRIDALLAYKQAEPAAPAEEAAIAQSEEHAVAVSEEGIESADKHAEEHGEQAEPIPTLEGQGEPITTEAELKKEEAHAAQLEEEVQELRKRLRKTSFEAGARIRQLEAQLAESEQQVARLAQKIREVEHAAAWAQRLSKFLTDIATSGHSDRPNGERAAAGSGRPEN